jgi:hypothetical protein
MKKLLLALVLAALSIGATAQPVRSQGNITTQNTGGTGACTSGGCVEIDIASRGAVTVQVTGTYTGALSGQATTDGQTWVTLAASGSFTNVASGSTSATITSGTTGLFRVAGVVGALKFRITGLAAMTGLAAITLQTAPVPPESSTTISGGAGDASAANQVTGNASLASIDGKLPALSGSRVPVVDLTSVAQGSTTSGQSGQMVQGAVTTAAPTYTTAQTSPLSLDTSGSLRVAIMSGAGSGGTASTVGAATPSTATAIGGNDGTNMQVPRVADLDTGAGSQYALITSMRLGASGGGVELVGGAGAVSAGVLRTTQASDSPMVTNTGAQADAVCGTDTGTCSLIALIKKINSNLTTSNVQLPADGTGQVTMANSFPVVLASDQSAIALHGHGATGAAVPANVQAAGARAGANSVNIAQGSATAAINVSTATTTQIVALSGSTVTYVTGLAVIAGGTGNITLVYGTGSNCGTGTTSLSGAIPLIANAGLTLGSGLGPVVVVPAGQALCVTTSAAVQMSGFVTYTQF